jgi:tryptophan 2,3-dioxygenase
MDTPAKRLTHYADYLQLDTILSAQHMLSDHPDEMHFIIIHQVHELWFKLSIHHLDRARQAMQSGQIEESIRLIQQVIAIFENLRHTAEHLHTLPPQSFHVFRQLLAAGSGMQSYQFRQIEILSGRRDEAYLEFARRTMAHEGYWEQVSKYLEAPSLFESFEVLIKERNIPDIATIYEYPDRCPDLYALADALSVLDHTIARWRYTHIQLVERTIGAGTTGTGGTMQDYLLKGLQVRLFPSLWEARNELSRRIENTRAGSY